MKKKFLVFTLCFTLIFTSLNYKKVNALDFVISPTMLGITCALGVGAGLALNSNEDIYKLGRGFVEFMGIDKYNEMSALVSSSALHAINGMIKLPQTLIDDYSNFFDLFVSKAKDGNVTLGYESGAPSDGLLLSYSPQLVSDIMNGTIPVGSTLYKNSKFSLILQSISSTSFVISDGRMNVSFNAGRLVNFSFKIVDGVIKYYFTYNTHGGEGNLSKISAFGDSAINFPYAGGYNPDYLKEKKENDTWGVYVPDNLGSLVGNSSYDPTIPSDDAYAPGGSITSPTVDNPAIELGNDITIPIDKPDVGDTDVPGNPSVPGVGNPSVPSLPSLPSWGSGLDFSPITQGVFTDKFPFCLAKDVGDIISVFDVESKAPVFKIPFVSEELTIDLTEFELWFDIMRFFILIGFIISLIVLTRGIIG